MDMLNVFRIAALLSSGLAAGAMLGHLLLLGSFINFFFTSGKAELFAGSYPVFLKSHKWAAVFNYLFILSILCATAYFVVLLIQGKLGGLPLSAVVLQWAFIPVFYCSGLAALEHKLFKEGITAPEVTENFLKRNVPVLTTLVILLLTSFVLFSLIPW